MERVDNYRLQVEQAQRHFLRYDQEKLIQKLKLEADGEHLYTQMLGTSYRIHRGTGQIQRLDTDWVETHDHGEVMTLLDMVCDSREDRFPAGRWQNMLNFGSLFHRSLMEDRADPFAERIQGNQEGFCRACEALGGIPGPGGDISFVLPVFEELRIAVQFWEGDDEFPSQIRWLWDENALMYLKYETMWFAVGLLRTKLRREMEKER